MTARREIDEVLDAFHAAAAAANAERYFATLSPGVVFLGTAPGERWEGEAFRDFVRSHFSRGRGWAYSPSGRSVVLAADGSAAWFDESLENEHYGTCRGSGVLLREGERWRIAQYDLSIPVPDEIASDVVSMIRRAS